VVPAEQIATRLYDALRDPVTTSLRTSTCEWRGFASEVSDTIKETRVGNFMVKHDPDSRRVIVIHAGDRQIRTFYRADGRDSDPYQAAVDLAREN
jgi:hypothetical protein